MKATTKKVLLLLLLFQVYTFSLSSAVPCCTIQDTVKEVILRGKLAEDKIERSLLIPIKATLTENSMLELYFYCSVANLTISISKGDEVVEQRTLSVSSSQVESFDLSRLGSGVYHLEMTTTKGAMIEGEFVLE